MRIFLRSTIETIMPKQPDEWIPVKYIDNLFENVLAGKNVSEVCIPLFDSRIDWITKTIIESHPEAKITREESGVYVYSINPNGDIHCCFSSTMSPFGNIKDKNFKL